MAMPSSTETLPVGFGAATATFVVISSMVGVGVLTTSGFTVAAVGSNGLMLLLWLVGGLVALCGALTVAELAAAIPTSGGDYVFLYEAYGPLPAFLSGWVSFLVGFSAPIAASAAASAKYLLAPLDLAPPSAQLFGRIIASLAIFAFSAIHVAGRTSTVRVHSAITVIKLAVLLAFLAAGLAVGLPHASNLADLPTAIDGKLAGAMLFSLVYISYGYTGWNSAAYLSGEVADPGRTLPRAIVLGTAAVIVLYFGLNAVYAMALPAAEVRTISDVAPIAELAARRLFGATVAGPLSIAIGLTLLASLSAYVLTGPRVMYAMARAGHFPGFAGRLWSRTQTPALGTTLQAIWALVLLWSGSFENIVVYAGVGLALFSMLAVSAIFALRWRQPLLSRPFRTPLYPLVPGFFLLATAALTAAAFLERPRVSLYALASILAGVPVYYFAFARQPKARAEV
jgi:APA family basic amino acid/polyamine antiporter